MPATALLFAFALAAADVPAPAPAQQGEPLPAGAPTQDYPLTAWCYGAMSEYLDIYEHIKPDLRDIDKLFGSSVPNEAEPYASDMAAAHDELKMLADAIVAAEKASPTSIGDQGADAIKLGRSIWAPAEAKTSRELARAWLSWAMPDRCDSTARALAARSALLGQALKYNTPSADSGDATSSGPTTPPPTGAPSPDSVTQPQAQNGNAGPVAAQPPEQPQPAPPPTQPASVDSLLEAPPPQAPQTPAAADPNSPIPDPVPAGSTPNSSPPQP